MEDGPRAGRPSTSKTDDNVERVRSLVRSDRPLMLRMISSELNLNRFTVQLKKSEMGPQILLQPCSRAIRSSHMALLVM